MAFSCNHISSRAERPIKEDIVLALCRAFLPQVCAAIDGLPCFSSCSELVLIVSSPMIRQKHTWRIQTVCNLVESGDLDDGGSGGGLCPGPTALIWAHFDERHTVSLYVRCHCFQINVIYRYFPVFAKSICGIADRGKTASVCDILRKFKSEDSLMVAPSKLSSIPHCYLGMATRD